MNTVLLTGPVPDQSKLLTVRRVPNLVNSSSRSLSVVAGSRPPTYKRAILASNKTRQDKTRQ